MPDLSKLDVLDILRIVGPPLEVEMRAERRRQERERDRMIAGATGRTEKDVRAERKASERANKKSKFAT